MQQPILTKIPPRRTLSFRKGGSLNFLTAHPWACDFFLVFFVVALGFGFTSYFQRYAEPLEATVHIDLSVFALPKYTFFSMCRGILGYILSLIFSLIWGFWTAKDRFAERFLIPILDVLQSIPILGFMPGLILLLVGIFPRTNVGLELAAIVMIFTSQAWNMAFGVYHSLRIIPQDKIDCATTYRFSSWQRMKWLDIPYTVISLIWNSIMSMAGGWFFLIVNESFKLGERDFRLPGLGSYMSQAAASADIAAMLWGIVFMILLIVFLDEFLWRPLIAWSQRFRVEETGVITYSDPLISQVIAHSRLVRQARKGCACLSQLLFRVKIGIPGFFKALVLSRIGLAILLTCIGAALIAIVSVVAEISWEQWLDLGYMTCLTFSRVLCCLVIGTLIALPLGLMIGLSEKLSKRLEPLIQIAASFPATLLFPIIILLLHKAGISLQIGSVALMMTGTLWYILFNVIAGAKAMPSDLREVAATFHLKTRYRLLRVYIPSVFPYLVTGLISGAGGAWNASIVAEYVTYQNEVLEVPGIGSMINLSAQHGQIPLLVASVLVMASVVVTLNYQGWLRLFHYSEKRFSLTV